VKKYEFADSECENAKRNNPGRWRERKHKEKGNNECEQHTNNDSAGRRWRRGAPGGEWRHSGRVQGADFMCVCCENEWEVNAGSAGSFSVCVSVSVWLLAVAKATKQK